MVGAEAEARSTMGYWYKGNKTLTRGGLEGSDSGGSSYTSYKGGVEAEAEVAVVFQVGVAVVGGGRLAVEYPGRTGPSS